MNWRQPGVKEYLVVGGVVVVGALAYMWWKNRQAGGAASAPASSAPASSASGSRTGTTTENLKLWIMDHQSSPKKHKPGKSPASPSK